MPRTERPLDPDGTALTEFASGLRELRRQAGGLPYRELARRAHFSSTTLSDAAGGKRAPSLAVTLAYVRACDGDVVEWERRWHALARESDSTTEAAAPGDGRAPYTGLAAYQADDADWFYGRESLVEDLANQVGARRFVTVVGPSGSGKSSLLRAGLLPLLASAGSTVVLFTPGAHPVEECAIHLAGLVGSTAGAVAGELADDERALHRLARQALTATRADAGLVVVIDQFEEVFTRCRDSAERRRFIALLVQAGRATDSRCRVVIGVRADFYGHCLLDADLAAASRDATLAVGPMNVDELRRAVVHPAHRAECTVETALLTTLVAHASSQPGALPLLSHALLETWRHRKGNALTLACYQRTGGIDGALARTAETVFTALTPAEQTAARSLLLRLVELGEGTHDTKRRVARTELDQDVNTILDAFVAARLLVVTDRDVEIAHEALVSGWPRLRAWLAADRDGQRVHRQLTEATATWARHDRDPSTLLRGIRLSVTEEWARDSHVVGARRHPGVNSAERSFLDASIAAEAAERRGARQRSHILRGLVVLLVVLLVVTTITAVRANRQRDRAVALHVVRFAYELIDSNPALAAQISLVAYRRHPTQVTREALTSTSAAASALPLNALSAQVIIDPSGRFIATGDPTTDTTILSTITTDGTAEAARLPGGDQPAVFSQDGDTMATVDEDATTRLWNMAESRPPYLLAALPVKARTVRFSNHGALLATTDAGHAPPDAPSRLWDISDPRRPRLLAILPGTGAEVFGFSDDGRTLLTVDHAEEGNPGKTLLWDITNPKAPRPAGRIDEPGRSRTVHATFVGDHQVLIMNDAGHLSIWDRNTQARLHRFAAVEGYSPNVSQIATSPLGPLFGTAGLTTGSALWDTRAGQHPALELRRPRETNLAHLGFSRDGMVLQAILWKNGDDVPQRPAGSILISWQMDPEAAASVVCETTAQITRSQWDAYFGELPYQPACR